MVKNLGSRRLGVGAPLGRSLHEEAAAHRARSSVHSGRPTSEVIRAGPSLAPSAPDPEGVMSPGTSSLPSSSTALVPRPAFAQSPSPAAGFLVHNGIRFRIPQAKASAPQTPQAASGNRGKPP